MSVLSGFTWYPRNTGTKDGNSQPIVSYRSGDEIVRLGLKERRENKYLKITYHTSIVILKLNFLNKSS